MKKYENEKPEAPVPQSCDMLVTMDTVGEVQHAELQC